MPPQQAQPGVPNGLVCVQLSLGDDSNLSQIRVPVANTWDIICEKFDQPHAN